MTEETKTAEDTSTEATDEGKGLAFELVDAEPSSDDSTPAEPEQGLILGKYKTIEEQLAAHKEAERAMHAAKEEAAAYKAALENIGTQIPAQNTAPPDVDGINEQFREQLENDPLGTMQQFFQYQLQDAQRIGMERQEAVMKEYQTFATNPDFADVADDVMRELPHLQNPDIEKIFMAKKLDRLKSGAQEVQLDASNREALGRKMHVESGGVGLPKAETVKIENDANGRAIQNVFGMDEKSYESLSKRAAYVEKYGTLNKMTGKKELDIGQWEQMKKDIGA
jgi:hypothetical protein